MALYRCIFYIYPAIYVAYICSNFTTFEINTFANSPVDFNAYASVMLDHGTP